MSMIFRVLSLNAWGGRIHGPLLPYLTACNPDVLCLQEVVRTPAATADWLTYRGDGADLPQRANLFDEIGEALPGHHAFFAPAARGALFDGAQAFASEFGLATFIRGDHAVLAHALDFVHGDFSANGWGEHPRPRNAHCLRVFDYRSGRAVTVAQMHGLRDTAGKADTPARIAQATALAKLIERVRRPGETLVVCGDFNVLPHSATFSALARFGLVDLVTSRGFTDTRTSYYRKEGRFADYMFVDSNVAVAAFDVVEQPEVSDHRALLLDIALPPSD